MPDNQPPRLDIATIGIHRRNFMARGQPGELFATGYEVRIVANEQCTHAATRQFAERKLDLRGRTSVNNIDGPLDGYRCFLQFAFLKIDFRVVRVNQSAEPRRLRYEEIKKFEPLRHKAGEDDTDACDISTGPVETKIGRAHV